MKFGSDDMKHETELGSKPDKKAIAIRCSIHGWMNAFVRAFDHPYCAVTSVGADMKDPAKPVYQNMDAPEVGTFELKGVTGAVQAFTPDT